MEQQIVLVEEIPAGTIKINPQEMRIIEKIIQGKTSKEIGEELGLAKKTVETHRHNVMKRLECKNMIQLTVLLFRKKLLS